jgi:Domain of unknown function (DUF932)
MELFKAHQQWANRPADERFDSLEALHAETLRYATVAQEKKHVPFSDMRVENRDGDVQLVGRADVPAKLTHWAFGQLCQKVGAPASYIRELPATLACNNLNHGLATRVANSNNNEHANLMFHANGGLLLRSIMTDEYARIWNHEVAERLLDMQPAGWEPARPDIRQSMGDFPALYASDHDMFAFLRNSRLTVAERGSDGAVYKGVIVENSEVGASALKMTRFLYREMCGNHIIWGASKVLEISIRHVGNARGRWSQYFAQIRRYADESVSDLEAKIATSKERVIGATKEDVLDALFGKRIPGLSRKVIESGYDAVIPSQDGRPNTVWGIAQGLTRHSQTLQYADKRTEIDRAAGKVLEATF